MNILIVSNAYPPAFHGGAELVAHAQAKALVRRGHEVRVFAGGRGPEVFEGIAVERVESAGDVYDAGVEARFAEILRSRRPDVVHFHNLVGLSTGIIGQAKRAGVKTVLTVHDAWGFCQRQTMLRPDGSLCDDATRCDECRAYVADATGRPVPIRVRNDFLRDQFDELDAIVSPSRFLAGAYGAAGFPAEPLHVIGNGVDLERFAGLVKAPGERTRFTFIGHLGEHKGVLVLLDAIGRLSADGGVAVNIVGDGPLLGRVRDEAGRNDAIVVWGKTPNERIGEVLSQTDVLVAPSIWPENQSGVILEAMASATPVIATRLGGNVELIDDGVTGVLVTPRCAASLARRMRELAGRPGRVAAMGRAARAAIEGFTFDNQVRLLLDLYREPSMPRARTPLVLCDARRLPATIPDGRRFVPADWFGHGVPEHARALWVEDGPPASSTDRRRETSGEGVR